LTEAEKDLSRDNKKKDSKALFYIFQAVNKTIFPKDSSINKVQTSMGHSSNNLSRDGKS